MYQYVTRLAENLGVPGAYVYCVYWIDHPMTDNAKKGA